MVKGKRKSSIRNAYRMGVFNRFVADGLDKTTQRINTAGAPICQRPTSCPFVCHQTGFAKRAGKNGFAPETELEKLMNNLQ